MNEFNTAVVNKTLNILVSILEKNNIQYRFLGSIVFAALNGRLHRNIGDLDLLVDLSGKDILFKELKKLGYYQADGIFAFGRKYLALETLKHTSLLEVGFFYGKWKDDGAFVMGNEKANLEIEPHAVRATPRELNGIHFVSIPDRAIAAGVYTSRTNPKRQKEIEILKEKEIEPLPHKYIHVTILKVHADWIYHLSIQLLNIIGAIRVRMGMAFDP